MRKRDDGDRWRLDLGDVEAAALVAANPEGSSALEKTDCSKYQAYFARYGKGAELYAAYQVRLKELNAADFGDLLLECLRLFQQHPDVLAEMLGYWGEYEQTNRVLPLVRPQF